MKLCVLPRTDPATTGDVISTRSASSLERRDVTSCARCLVLWWWMMQLVATSLSTAAGAGDDVSVHWSRNVVVSNRQLLLWHLSFVVRPTEKCFVIIIAGASTVIVSQGVVKWTLSHALCEQTQVSGFALRVIYNDGGELSYFDSLHK